MRLSELMSALGPTGLTEVALLLFLAVFIAVGVRAWRTGADEQDRNARLPLDGDLP
ncbi:MAG: hypothetical protein K8M05_03500 [Deltaproteobacteria bacterium]|nr:hypothetical protein [Kofleriaceae bacterium]